MATTVAVNFADAYFSSTYNCDAATCTLMAALLASSKTQFYFADAAGQSRIFDRPTFESLALTINRYAANPGAYTPPLTAGT